MIELISMLLSTSVLITLISIFGGLFIILLVCFVYAAINRQAVAKEDDVKKKNKKIARIRYRSAISLEQNKTKK